MTISYDELRQKQSLPLEAKIVIAKQRIREWYEAHEGDVYVSFSGGKDSTVLLHLVRSIYPDVTAVFCDTGLEYPEIKQFVKSHKNVLVLHPAKPFRQVIEEHGWPLIDKKTAGKLKTLQNPSDENKQTRRLYLEGIRSDGTKSKAHAISKKWRFLIDAPFKISADCCDFMKKIPFRRFEKYTGLLPYIGTMAVDSDTRKLDYMKRGCNVFHGKKRASRPLSIWKEEDIWEYIRTYDVSYCSVYDKGVERTGCLFCGFGAHLDKGERYIRLKELHPKIWKYCMYELGLGEVLDYCGIEWGKEK